MRTTVLLLLICIVSTVLSVRKKTKEKSASTNPVRTNIEHDDATRTLQDWLLLDREALQLICHRHHLIETGSKDVLAIRLYNFFHPSLPRTDTPGSTIQLEVPPATNNPSTNRIRRPRTTQNARQALSSSATVTTSHLLSSNPTIDTTVADHVNSSNPTTAVDQSNTLPIANVIRNELRALLSSPEFQSPSSSANNIDDANSDDDAEDAVFTADQTSVPAVSYVNNIHNGAIASALPIRSMQPPMFAGPSSLIAAAPKSVVNQIKRGEYISFDSLLPAPAALRVGSVDLSQGNQGTPALSLVPKDNTKRVRDFSSWLTAWNTYIRIYTHFHPHMVHQLLYYQSMICKFATQYEFSAWYTYDTQFRHRIATNPTLPWDRVDEELFTEHVRGRQAAGSRVNSNPCYYCQSTGHFANNCPLRLSHGASNNQQSTATITRPISQPTAPIPAQPFRAPQPPTTIAGANNNHNNRCCHFYNIRGCSNAFCQFLHQCNLCRGNHPATHCFNRRFSNN